MTSEISKISKIRAELIMQSGRSLRILADGNYSVKAIKQAMRVDEISTVNHILAKETPMYLIPRLVADGIFTVETLQDHIFSRRKHEERNCKFFFRSLSRELIAAGKMTEADLDRMVESALKFKRALADETRKEYDKFTIVMKPDPRPLMLRLPYLD